MKLKIAKGYTIDLTASPFDTMGLRAFTSGMSGAGKSYTQMKFIEEAFDAKLQFCLLDVHGEGHVLGELGDNVMVVSDRFGIPVVKAAIPIYLDALQNGMSIVVDLKPMFYDDEDLFFSFVEDFLRKFMSLWSKVMTPILLCFDEAQEIMPQSPPKGIRELYKVVKKIVLGGRKSGVHYLLASQRPALIDKTPISQANVRLFGKMEETADWNAIKNHVKPFTLEDMKKLRSGEFILSTEGKATKVHVLKRKTTDAGATPTFKPKFTDVQKVKMGDISQRIEELIAKAKEEAEKAEEEKSLLKKLERQLESSKQREKELKVQISTIELISDKMSGRPSGKVDAKAVYDEVRGEFNKELGELRKRHKKLIDGKDKEVHELQGKVAHVEEATKKITVFYDAWRTITSMGPQGATSAAEVPSDIVDRVVEHVLKRIPSGGTSYTVAPLKALKKDWEQKALAEMKVVIDGLNAKQLKILSFMLASENGYARTALSMRLFGTRKGGVYTEFVRNVAGLLGNHLLAEGEGKSKMLVDSIDGYVSYYASTFSPSDDDSYLSMVPHVIEHIRTKGDE